MKEKKFNYSMDEIQGIYDDINTMFALEGLSEDDEDDLEDYDPEDDVDDDTDDIDEEDYDKEIDDDEDPAEEEDDEYDDVVENVGISHMDDFLTADEEDTEMLMQTNNAVEAAFGLDFDPPEPKTKVDPDDMNSSIRIKDFVSVLDPRPDFEERSASDILDLFEDTYLKDDDDE